MTLIKKKHYYILYNKLQKNRNLFKFEKSQLMNSKKENYFISQFAQETNNFKFIIISKFYIFYNK